RLPLDRVEVAVQLQRDVVGLDRERAQALGDRVERRVHTRDRVELPTSGAEQLAGAPLPARRRDRLGARARRRAQRLQVAQALTLGPQVGLLRLARVGLLDLTQLELEQVKLALARAVERAELLGTAQAGAHLGVGGGGRTAARPLVGAAEAV